MDLGSTEFRLVTLGGLSVERGGQPYVPTTIQRRQLAVLVLIGALGRGTGGSASRDRLIGFLWPDRPPEKARNLLDQALSAARRTFGADVVISSRTSVALNPAVLALDVAEFDDAIRTGAWARAIRLYGGAFLDGVELDRAPEFERWVESERGRCARAYGSARGARVADLDLAPAAVAFTPPVPPPVPARRRTTVIVGALIIAGFLLAGGMAWLRPVVIDPSAAQPLARNGLLLAERGRLADGEAQVRRAQLLDPRSAEIGCDLGEVLFWERRYAEAERQLRATLAMHPMYWQARRMLGLVALAAGHPRDGITELARVLNADSTRAPGRVALLGYAYAVAGVRDSATALLNEALARSAQTPHDSGGGAAVDLALLYVGLGDADDAFRWLQQAYRAHDPALSAVMPSPLLAPLASDVRLADLRARMHLN